MDRRPKVCKGSQTNGNVFLAYFAVFSITIMKVKVLVYWVCTHTISVE